MIKNPTVFIKVPVRFHKGFFDVQTMNVRVKIINYKNRTMTVEYETDMYDNGVTQTFTLLTSDEAFRKRYRV